MGKSDAGLDGRPNVLFSETGLTRYDRRGSLTSTETEAIKKLLTMNGRYSDMVWPAGIQILWSPYDLPELERLVRPIVDVIDATDKNEFQIMVDRCRRRAVRVLLREMYTRRRAFWDWTQNDWAETVCVSVDEFLRRHRIMADCRLNIMCVGYFIGSFTDFRKLSTSGKYEIYNLSCRLFGREAVQTSVTRILDELRRWGYSNKDNFKLARTTICEALIAVRSPHLEDITLDVLANIRKRTSQSSKSTGGYVHTYALAISKALVGLGILKETLTEDLHFNRTRADISSIGMSADWASWCKRWRATSTLQPRARKTAYYGILMAGRWLFQEHPHVTNPAQWTRELAAEYVAAVDRALIGQWSSGLSSNKQNIGKPLRPYTKDRYLSAARTFFKDCHEWEWIPQRFNPHQALRTPSSVYKLIGRNPRVINDDIWAKLLWAGLNLVEDDLPMPNAACKKSGLRYYYTLEMMRALVIVWLFAGLRGDEIIRLRLGCIRWQGTYSAPGELAQGNTACLLLVPTGKTAPEFVKPVDRVVGEAIETWERVRTDTPLMNDYKTSEMVSYLFARRTKPIGKDYINRVVIPMLCRKANIPRQDARGRITCHRARSTIATQLSDSMTLLQLMEWLGHSNPETTLHYVQTPVMRLASAYKNADYLERNVRTARIVHEAPEIEKSESSLRAEPARTTNINSVLAKLTEGRRELSSMRQAALAAGQPTIKIDESIKSLDALCQGLAEGSLA